MAKNVSLVTSREGEGEQVPSCLNNLLKIIEANFFQNTSSQKCTKQSLPYSLEFIKTRINKHYKHC